MNAPERGSSSHRLRRAAIAIVAAIGLAWFFKLVTDVGLEEEMDRFKPYGSHG